MAKAEQILAAASSILLVDWPSRDVPETLARAGYQVFVKGGPGPADFSAYEVRGGEVVSVPAGRVPEHADVVYCHRPVGELPQIVVIARQVGATVVWHQSGLTSDGQRDPRGCWASEATSGEARTIVEAAGLTYLHEPYIADVARRITPGRAR